MVGVLAAVLYGSLLAGRQRSTANQRYTQFADGFALGPSGLLPTGPLESLGRTGRPMQGSAKLPFPDRLRVTSMSPLASHLTSAKSLVRRLPHVR